MQRHFNLFQNSMIHNQKPKSHLNPKWDNSRANIKITNKKMVVGLISSQRLIIKIVIIALLISKIAIKRKFKFNQKN